MIVVFRSSLPPSRTFVWLGGLLITSLWSACYRQDISYVELVNLVAKNECARADLVATPMLIVIRDGDSTRFVQYPNEQSGKLTDTSLVQLGALTASFLVPKILLRLEQLGLGLDSVALLAGGNAGASVRPITYGDLLLHHSGLPPYRAPAETPARQQLADMLADLHQQSPLTTDTAFHFDHWNYTLAVWSLEQRERAPANTFRSTGLRYVDQADSTLRVQLAPSAAPSQPARTQSAELFLLSTGGLSSAHLLSKLLDSMATVKWGRLSAKPTTPSRPGISITLGWYRQQVPNHQFVLTNAGRTRRHGAAVAYNPFTDTGVAVLIGDSKPADCLALDILRNLNRDWKRPPINHESQLYHE